MNDNPYKAPESDLTIAAGESNTHFYVVSVNKFTMLFFLTLGIYALYWFYKNWKEYKEYSGKKIWPVPRAIFSIFFTHSLFSEVESSLKSKDKSFDWNPSSLATAYVILAIVSQILDKMSMKEIGSPISDLSSILILALMYMPLLKAQKAINFSQGDPEGHSNELFTGANYVWMVIGILLWLMTLFGFMVMFGLINI